MNRVDWLRVFRYLLTGGTAFAIDFGLLALFKSVLGIPAWLAAALAFIISTVFAFLGQKYFTYASQAPTGKALLRYLILLGANTIFTALVVQAFDSWFQLYLVGKIVATAITTLWNYPIMGHWVYHQGTEATVTALDEVESANARSRLEDDGGNND